MKRKGNLYTQVCSEQNIAAAFNNARCGKLHYREVKKIEANRPAYEKDLRLMLLNNAFVNSPYQIVEKQSGQKLRTIYKLPYYPDRIVHHCLVQVLQPIWIKSLIRDTFSTIPGRGIHDGVKRVKNALNDVDNTFYCLKFDIEKYYPSVKGHVLKQVIRKKIKDTLVLNIIDGIIDSAPGIPIGNYISQWFGNLYLCYFDHFVKQQLHCRYYFRYCDDMVILAPDKATLWAVFYKCVDYLQNELQLNVKNNYQVFPVNNRGIDFLGYRFFHGYTLVRKRIVKSMKQKLNNPKSMASYWGWLAHANTYRLTQKYFKATDNETLFRFCQRTRALRGRKNQNRSHFKPGNNSTCLHHKTKPLCQYQYRPLPYTAI